MPAPPTPKPFQFCTTLTLQESTGLSAVSLAQFVKYLRVVPAPVIYHHTHRYLRQRHDLTPEPSSDFAYWVTSVLGERELGEQLGSIDTVQFTNLEQLRERLVAILERHLRDHPWVRLRIVTPPEAFYFVSAVSVILRTPHQAATLREFAEALQAVTLDSFYFHMFEARLRLPPGPYDFPRWFDSLGETRLAKTVAALDPYTHTMEELRQAIIRLVRAQPSFGEPAR